jgi:hypothetical protein
MKPKEIEASRCEVKIKKQLSTKKYSIFIMVCGALETLPTHNSKNQNGLIGSFQLLICINHKRKEKPIITSMLQ